MRKVKFNKYIPRVYEGSKAKEGTGCWEKDFPNDGLFHQWGNAYEESEYNFGNYTVALIELQDGTITEVLPRNIKFK